MYSANFHTMIFFSLIFGFFPYAFPTKLSPSPLSLDMNLFIYSVFIYLKIADIFCEKMWGRGIKLVSDADFEIR